MSRCLSRANIGRRGGQVHYTPDDTQIYRFCSLTPSSCTELQSRISECIDVASSWMRSQRLQLNTDKTEIIWLTTGRCSHLLPQQPLWVGSDIITPVLVVRDLGIHIDRRRRFHWDPTSRRLRLPVLLFYVSFGVCAARYLELSSSHWCRVWCYSGWTTAMQC